MKRIAWLFVLLTTASCARKGEATSGAIEGSFVFQEAASGDVDRVAPGPAVAVNSANGGIADIFVYLRTAPEVVDASLQTSRAKEVVIESRGGDFHPHTAVARTDQEIRWINSDPTTFMLQIYGIANSNQVLVLPSNDKSGATIRLAKPEPVPIPVEADCDPQHAGQWMSLLVVDHPYAAVTDRDGRFRIEGLPPGEHAFRVWHRRSGWIEKDWKVTVVSGVTTKVPAVQVPEARFAPVKSP